MSLKIYILYFVFLWQGIMASENQKVILNGQEYLVDDILRDMDEKGDNPELVADYLLTLKENSYSISASGQSTLMPDSKNSNPLDLEIVFYIASKMIQMRYDLDRYGFSKAPPQINGQKEFELVLKKGIKYRETFLRRIGSFDPQKLQRVMERVLKAMRLVCLCEDSDSIFQKYLKSNNCDSESDQNACNKQSMTNFYGDFFNKPKDSCVRATLDEILNGKECDPVLMKMLHNYDGIFDGVATKLRDAKNSQAVKFLNKKGCSIEVIRPYSKDILNKKITNTHISIIGDDSLNEPSEKKKECTLLAYAIQLIKDKKEIAKNTTDRKFLWVKYLDSRDPKPRFIRDPGGLQLLMQALKNNETIPEKVKGTVQPSVQVKILKPAKVQQ